MESQLMSLVSYEKSNVRKIFVPPGYGQF
jgi:hypothetical protein